MGAGCFSTYPAFVIRKSHTFTISKKNDVESESDEFLTDSEADEMNTDSEDIEFQSDSEDEEIPVDSEDDYIDIALNLFNTYSFGEHSIGNALVHALPKPSETRKRNKKPLRLCSTYQVCREYVLVLGFSNNFFNTQFDDCYCDVVRKLRIVKPDKSNVETLFLHRPSSVAKYEYTTPHGWARFALKVDEDQNGEIWTWARSYFGICSLNVVKTIVDRGHLLLPGRQLLNGDKMPAILNDSKHFYTSPSIAYTALPRFTTKQTFIRNGRTRSVKIVLECRQRPQTFIVQSGIVDHTDPIPLEKRQWCSDQEKDCIPVALLIFLQVTESYEIRDVIDDITEQYFEKRTPTFVLDNNDISQDPIKTYQNQIKQKLSELKYIQWPLKDVERFEKAATRKDNFTTLPSLKALDYILETIIKNHIIAETYRQLILDLLVNYSYDMWLQPFQNMLVGSGVDKDVNQLIHELAYLNRDDPDLLTFIKNDLLSLFQRIKSEYEKNTSQWSANEIQQWVNRLPNSSLLRKQHIEAEAIQRLLCADALRTAVIMRGIYLHTGHLPRDIQLLAVLLLICTPQQGRLAQIKTGEGKSTIVCMLAAFFALPPISKAVDIITTSEILAMRDVKEFAKFYQLFGMTASSNTARLSKDKLKESYQSNIVYGTVSAFVGDLLSTEYYLKDVRKLRKYEVAIVDEVDSMFIDDSTQSTRLSSPTPGWKSLSVILRMLWKSYSENKVSSDRLLTVMDHDGKQVQTTIHSHILSSIESGKYIRLPQYRQEFVNFRVPKWISSAEDALYKKKENCDYVVKDNIHIVDYSNTGIIHKNMTWSEGLHQFLQMKHHLRLSPEEMCDSSYSNISFFKRYRPLLFGLTGTLGSKPAQNFLRQLYGVDLVFVPKYKNSDFITYPATVCRTYEEWANRIKETCRIKLSNRAVLIISETIQSAESIHTMLASTFGDKRIQNYTRNDRHKLKCDIDTGDIVIATNLAGRGTDLKPSQPVNDHGGLHVMVTFMPKNLRVEEQAFGRAGRSGEPGSACIVVQSSDGDTIEKMKEVRDAIETKSIENAKKRAGQIEAKDKRLIEFLKLIQENKIIDLLKDEYRPAFGSIRETWALLCEAMTDIHDDNQKDMMFAVFSKQMHTKLASVKQHLLEFQSNTRSLPKESEQYQQTKADNDVQILIALVDYPKYLLSAALTEFSNRHVNINRYVSRGLKLIKRAHEFNKHDFIVWYMEMAFHICNNDLHNALKTIHKAIRLLTFEINARKMLPPFSNSSKQQMARSTYIDSDKSEIIFLKIVLAAMVTVKRQLKNVRERISFEVTKWETVVDALNGTTLEPLKNALAKEVREWKAEGLFFKINIISR